MQGYAMQIGRQPSTYFVTGRVHDLHNTASSNISVVDHKHIQLKKTAQANQPQTLTEPAAPRLKQNM